MALSLGTVTFQGFEIPEKVNFGGRHALVTHKLPGGQRVIDAMGRDDDDIAWGGRFRGNSAERRARAVDAMRVSGLPVTLSWGGFRYTVVVAEFKADYQQPYEIPYTISCLVATGAAPALAGVTDLIGTDLGSALGLAGDLSIQSVSDAVGGVQSAFIAAKSLKGGFPSGLAGLGDAVGIAQGVVGQAVTAADSVFSLAGLPSAGASGFASELLAQAGAMSQLDTLHALAGTVGRMARNVKTLGG